MKQEVQRPKKYEAKIYALTDCLGVPFYVGCTVKNIVDRYNGHLYEAMKNERWTNTEKNTMIRTLNFKFSIRVLDTLHVIGRNGYEAQRLGTKRERQWINRFIDAGYSLVNDGVYSGKKQRTGQI